LFIQKKFRFKFLLYIFVAGQLPVLKDNLKCTQNMVT